MFLLFTYFVTLCVCSGLVMRSRFYFSRVQYKAMTSKAETEASGKFVLFRGRGIGINVAFGSESSYSVQQLDTTCTYSQVNRVRAIKLGLVSHPKLISMPVIANGRVNYAYLAKCDVFLEGVRYSLVVKVGEFVQPVVGLDCMFASKMLLNFQNHSYKISTNPDFRRTTSGFAFIDLDAQMKMLGIKETDLVPFSALPATPVVACAESVIKNDKASFCFDLGSS